MKTPGLKRIATVLLATASLTACLIPDEYEATIEFAADGSYKYQFDGKMAYAPGQESLVNHGTRPDFNRAEFDKFIAGVADLMQNSKEEAVTVSKIDDATITAAIVGEGEAHRSRNIMQAMGEVVFRGEEVTVRTAKWKARDREAMEKLKLNSRGEICLKTELEVLSHNADEEPSLLSDCYLWNMDVVRSEPVEVVMRVPPRTTN